MLPPTVIQRPPSRRPGNQPKLDEIGLDHFLDRVARFAETSGQRFHAHGSTLVDIRDHMQIAPVHGVKTDMVDLQPGQRLISDLLVDYLGPGDIGKVPHAAEQAAGDARRAPRPAGHFGRTIRRDIETEQPPGGQPVPVPRSNRN